MGNFADYLTDRVHRTGSVLCAGLDPVMDQVPLFFKRTGVPFGEILVEYASKILTTLEHHIACIKPNIAFFEALGIEGIVACQRICSTAKEMRIPVILDCKRGDIGSTSEAYARAYLGTATEESTLVHTDAITVNPFLGFDTIEPFLNAARARSKGLFLLVRTSNPGAPMLQSCRHQESGQTASALIASWINEQGSPLIGSSGLSGLGMVLGATDPEEAAHLRSLAPNAYALIPGVGTQGGTARDALAGFRSDKTGGIINISRGLLGDLANCPSLVDFEDTLIQRARAFNNEIAKVS